MTSIDAAIEAYVDSLGIEAWPPLTTDERDLLRRTVGRIPSAHPADIPDAA